MKISKAEEKSITDWFIHEFWPVYPSEYTRSGKGSRQKALFSMLKVNPDENERRRILLNLKAQVRADKGKSDRVYWSIGVTYVNNHMWEDAVESVVEKTVDLKKCSQCDEPVHGERYRFCTKHIPDPTREMRKRIMTELGLLPGKDESISEWQNRCRVELLKKTRSGNLSMTQSLDDLYPQSYRRRGQ